MDYHGVIRKKQLQDMHLLRLMLISRHDQSQQPAMRTYQGMVQTG